LKKGYKISKFFDHSDNFCYWYCDIINYEYFKQEDKYILIDLLVDVKVTPEGKHKILDLEELAVALEKGIVEKNIVIDALKKLDDLLGLIDNGEFPPKECSMYKY